MDANNHLNSHYDQFPTSRGLEIREQQEEEKKTEMHLNLAGQHESY
jgi:hypothetical protein